MERVQPTVWPRVPKRLQTEDPRVNLPRKPSLYTTTGGLPDIVDIFAAKEKLKTVMVCGLCGSGKRAAVSVEGKKGVMVATLNSERQLGQKLAHAITDSLRLHTNKQVDHTEVVVKVLKLT